MNITRMSSLLKTISWRAIATTVTIILVYAITDKLSISLGVGLIEVSSKMVLYYIHERAWNRVSFGRIERKT